MRGKGKEIYTAFLVAQEHRGAGAGDKVAAIADKICKSEGTAVLSTTATLIEMWLRGKAIADKYGLHIKDPLWNEHLIHALGVGYLVARFN